MSLKFTPPKQTSYKYGVWSENRGFKVYSDLGSAKQGAYVRAGIYGSWTNPETRSRVIVTEMVGGEWYVLFDVPVGTRYNDLPWVKETTNWLGKPTGRFRAVTMTREEYADWRVAVELEKRGISV